VRESSLRSWRANLRDYLHCVARLPVATLTSADLQGCLAPVWGDKPKTAAQVLRRAGTVLEWAVAANLRTDNPARAVARAPALITWALIWPPDPDVSKGSGSEAERFAAVLPETVWQVDHNHRVLEGSFDPHRPPWWTLKDDAKKADIFKRALARVDYERRIRLKKGDGPWQDALRVAIERSALSPTRGQGMVRDALRANLVRYVAVATGLKVSRGRVSSPPYRTACDAVALAEAVWESGNKAGEDIAVLMLELLTDTPELSAAAAEENAKVIPALSSHLLVLCAGFSDHDRRHLRNRDPCPTDGVHLSLLPLECSNQTTSCGRTPDQRESCRRCRPDRTKACWPWCHLRGDSIPSSVRSSYHQRKILTIMARSAMLTSTEAGTPASLRVGRRIHGLDQARTPAASRA